MMQHISKMTSAAVELDIQQLPNFTHGQLLKLLLLLLLLLFP